LSLQSFFNFDAGFHRLLMLDKLLHVVSLSQSKVECIGCNCRPDEQLAGSP